jgi:hypothetical protein
MMTASQARAAVMETYILSNEDGTYDLMVNGRITIEKEARPVVHEVERLLHGGLGVERSKPWELAKKIRSSTAKVVRGKED